MKNIMLCLGTKKGWAVLDGLLRRFPKYKFHIIARNEKNVNDNYYDRILGLARHNKLPTITWTNFCKNSKKIIEENSISSLICVGWPYLVKETVMDLLDGEVVVAHDSLLPKYRGFTPLVSALISGESETGVTVLYAAEEVDAGDIIWQDKIDILENDTIGDLIEKTCPLYVEGIIKYLERFDGYRVDCYQQTPALVTYSIWRDDEDYQIDWNNSAAQIERHVRAVGLPYLGAKTTLKNRKVTVKKVTTVSDLDFSIRCPGKVWRLESGRPEVVCGSGMLRIEAAYNIDGISIIPMKSLRVRFK